MSGGVDSTVTAALLKRAGYDVVGVTLQLYDHGAASARKGACCAGQDIHDARTAAEALGIPHYVLDYESRFREAVIEEFADAYLRGETPIPACAATRRSSSATCWKWRATWAPRRWPPATMCGARRGRTARSCTARSIRRATRATSCSPPRASSWTSCAFRWAAWKSRWCGASRRELGLAVAAKPDSQDICFVPEGRYTTVIDRLRPSGGPCRRHRASRRPGAGPPRGRHPLHRGASGAG
jgi:tRNA-specific 2-thiouridylase